MTIVVVGTDLAKNFFAVHGVNENGKAELVRPAVRRDKLRELIASLSELHHLDEWIAAYDAHIALIARNEARARN